MIGVENADEKWSDKKMAKEDSLRTVECLRGRLLAERMTSRNAKENAEILGNKLIELEAKLREETKSRNKAEKKLEFLIKKLESKNLTYVSDEVSSRASQDSKVQDSQETECEESIGSNKSVGNNCTELMPQKCENNSLNLVRDSSQMSTSSQDNENRSTKSSETEFSKSDANSLKSSAEEEKHGGNEVDSQEDNVDNSLALVLIDLPKTEQIIDPIVLDATVKDVLDALRHAKEKIQTQMQRRQLIKAS